MRTILGLALAGYIAGCAHASQSGATNADTDMVSGTVAYRERMALPPDAVVTVTLADVSRQDVPATVIAETTVEPGGRQVPLPFELRFDRKKIDPKRTYAVRATIRSGGQLIFTTDVTQRVITQDNPTHVDLRLVRAGGVPNNAKSGLSGTAWLLEDLGGAGVMDVVEATLEFPDEGKAAGRGSCNRFFGSVEISGASISFSPLGSTRRACAEAVMNQETKYLKALEGAERFRIEGPMLFIEARGLDQPLRFIRTSSAAAPAGAWRAIGTEPFWGLEIDSTGLRFTTPEDRRGISWPPLTPLVTGDTLRWVGETERAAVDARIWPARCSDGMSDRVWPYAALVRIDSTTHRGCAESRARDTAADAVAGSWHVAAHRAPGIAAMSPQEADTWIGRAARYSRSLAWFGTNECSAPSYQTTSLTNQAFVEEFRVSPTDLGLRSPIQVVEVRCAEPWNGAGSRLFVKGPNELLTFWDGVYFELRRE